MEICLSDEEFGLLTEILKERHAALEHEIARTHHKDFKSMLKKRRDVLEKILEHMGVAEPTS